MDEFEIYFENSSELESGNGSSLMSNVTFVTPEDIINHPLTRAIIYFVYLVIFLLGICGNCLVCFVVFRAKHMQTVTNYFITNMAFADIWLCALAVPFTPIYFFMKRWIFGWFTCTLVSMAQGTSVYVSTLTLTSIAVDRYFVIIHPLKPKLSLRACYIIIIGIWTLSIALTILYAIYVKQIEHDGNFYCEEYWPSEALRRAFSLTTTILQFVIPFIVILYCYVMISVRMSERIRSRPGSRGSRKEESDREKKKRTNRMLIAMVFIFGGCWLPVNIVHLVGDYHHPASYWKFFNLFFFITHLIAMSSTCYNPILYAWLNENFRKEFQQVFRCFQLRRRNNSNTNPGEVLANPSVVKHGNNSPVNNFKHNSRMNRRGTEVEVCDEVIHLTVSEEVKSNGHLEENLPESKSVHV